MKTLKLGVIGLCEGNSPVTGEFPAQKASNAENVSIWWRHHNFDRNFYLVVTWTSNDSVHRRMYLSQGFHELRKVGSS